MHVSLNEVEALGRRASRGAGYAWGLAEEAGKAWRWLEGHGFGAAGLLADLLEDVTAGRTWPPLKPSPGIAWRAGEGRLCPIATGAALIDRVDAGFVEVGIVLGPTVAPLFLVPFAASLSRDLSTAMALEWPGVSWTLEPDGGCHAGDWAMVTLASSQEVRLARAAAPVSGERFAPRLDGVDVDPAAWARLDRFGARTYVPASDVSRLKGAGAGLLDTD